MGSYRRLLSLSLDFDSTLIPRFHPLNAVYFCPMLCYAVLGEIRIDANFVGVACCVAASADTPCIFPCGLWLSLNLHAADYQRRHVEHQEVHGGPPSSQGLSKAQAKFRNGVEALSERRGSYRSIVP